MGQRLYNSNDGLTGRDGGPYLDQVEVEAAEKRRAVVEGRDADLDNPPATAGIQLNTASQMIFTEDVNQPSRQNTFVADQERKYNASHDDDTSLLRAFTEIPDDALTNKSADEVEAVSDEPEPESESESDDKDKDKGSVLF